MSSIFLLFFLLVLAFISVLIKRQKFCIITLFFTLIYTLAISSGLIPTLLLKPLQAPFSDLPTLQWKKNNAIILLGGGTVQLPNSNTYAPITNAYSRIYKTAELYFSCIQKNACKIIISGGPIEHAEKSDALVYEQALMKLGVPLDDFILELNSTDTQTNAEFTKAILQQSTFDQIILVTSGIHMKRSLLWFSYFNIQVQPITSDYSKSHFDMKSLSNNFALTDSVLHEYLGIAEAYSYNFLHNL